MPKYIALHSFCVGNGIDVCAGDVVLVPDGMERQWIWHGHIIAAPDELVPADQVIVQENRPINRDPRPARTERR